MTPCVEWTKRRDKDGYGRVGRNGKSYRAHRLAWEEEHGPIPDGMMVLHRCDNPPCVNVEHLFLGTALDNMRDMVAKGRHARGPGVPDLWVKPIRQLVRDKIISQHELARIFGVSQCHISLIVNNKTRSHIK